MEVEERVFRALYDIGLSVGAPLDPSEWARRVAFHVRDLLGASAVALYVYEASEPELRLLHADASPPLDPTSIPPIPAGAGAVGKALLEQEVVALDNYPAWRGALPWTIARGVRSAAAVPLRVQGRAVGVLGADYDRPHRWTNEELRLLTLLAAQVAPALEAARLYQAAKAELAQRREAEEAARQSERRLAIILERLPVAVMVTDAAGVVVLANKGGRRLVGTSLEPAGSTVDAWAAVLQPRDPQTRRPLEREERICVRVLAGEEVNDFETLVRVPGEAEDRWLRGFGAPLRDEMGTLTGGVVVLSDVTRERQLLRDLSATALENARLLGELADRREELEALARRIVRSPVEERRRSVRRAEVQRLTARELEVLRLVVDGKTNKEIGRVLGIEVGTVRNYVQQILEKLGAVSRTQAAARAVELGLINDAQERPTY